MAGYRPPDPPSVIGITGNEIPKRKLEAQLCSPVSGRRKSTPSGAQHGTVTGASVPCPGRDLTSNVPFTGRARSCILSRPDPPPSLA